MAALVGFGFGMFGETNPLSYFVIATINASVMAISLIAVYCSTWEHSPEEVAQEKIDGIWEGVKKLVIDVLSTFRNRSFRQVLYVVLSTKIAAACIIAFNVFAAGSIAGISNMAISMIAYPVIFAIWKFFYVGFQYLPDVPLNYIPDIDELITLRRREGIYASAQQLVQQLASAIAVSAWGIVLAFSGFIETAGNSDAVTQPLPVPISICAYMLIGCAGFFILGAILGKRLHIDKEQCDMLCAEVKRVREGGKMEDVKPEVKALCEELSGFKYEQCFGHNNVGYQEKTVEPAEPLRDARGRARVFIAPHGHQGAGAASVAGVAGVPAVDDAIRRFNYDYGLRLARMGYVVACPEARGWGPRRDARGQGDAEELYLRGTCLVQAHMAEPLGLSVAGLMTWDLMRLVDYLESRGDLDTDDLGCLGFSGGGLQTLFLAAVDPRVSKAFISGYLYGYADALLHLNGNCACNYTPGLWRLFDMGDIAALIAPRPLVVQSCEQDHLNGPRGLENVCEQVDVVRAGYRLLGAEGNLLHEVCPGPHHLCVTNLPAEVAWLGDRARTLAAGAVDAR